jgi:hypothetical protein
MRPTDRRVPGLGIRRSKEDGKGIVLVSPAGSRVALCSQIMSDGWMCGSTPEADGDGEELIVIRV